MLQVPLSSPHRPKCMTGSSLRPRKEKKCTTGSLLRPRKEKRVQQATHQGLTKAACLLRPAPPQAPAPTQAGAHGGPYVAAAPRRQQADVAGGRHEQIRGSGAGTQAFLHHVGRPLCPPRQSTRRPFSPAIPLFVRVHLCKSGTYVQSTCPPCQHCFK